MLGKIPVPGVNQDALASLERDVEKSYTASINSILKNGPLTVTHEPGLMTNPEMGSQVGGGRKSKSPAPQLQLQFHERLALQESQSNESRRPTRGGAPQLGGVRRSPGHRELSAPLPKPSREGVRRLYQQQRDQDFKNILSGMRSQHDPRKAWKAFRNSMPLVSKTLSYTSLEPAFAEDLQRTFHELMDNEIFVSNCIALLSRLSQHYRSISSTTALRLLPVLAGWGAFSILAGREGQDYGATAPAEDIEPPYDEYDDDDLPDLDYANEDEDVTHEDE